jgi:hypothetical protein
VQHSGPLWQFVVDAMDGLCRERPEHLQTALAIHACLSEVVEVVHEHFSVVLSESFKIAICADGRQITYLDDSSVFAERTRCLMVSCCPGKASFNASKSETRRAFPVHTLLARPTRSLMSDLMGRPGSLQYCNIEAFHEVAGRSFNVRVVPIEDPAQPPATFTAFVSITHFLLAVPTYSKLQASIEDAYALAFSLHFGFVSKHLEVIAGLL